MELSIPLPSQFGFKRTVLSHGWYDLPPFHFDRPTWTLSRVLTLDAGAPVEVSITELDGLIKVAVGTKLPKKQAAAVDRSVRHMLRLDESFTEFYALAAADADLSWVAAEGAGRLLRAPAVFEDLVDASL